MTDQRDTPLTLHDVTEASARAQQQFMELVAKLRPELHRYCARMTGSVFDGEDVLQDTLAKAWFALGQMESPPPLRPWLFRIAHNSAMDFLKRYDQRHVETGVAIDSVSDGIQTRDDDDLSDVSKTEIALSILAALPAVQRSAFVLKDVIELSLEETAATMGTTVGAVKSALIRARTNIARSREEATPTSATARPLSGAGSPEIARMRRYAELFNARDWSALRNFFDEETRLDLVSYRQLSGAPAAQYFTRYEHSAPREDIQLSIGHVDGVPVLAVFRPSTSATPAYFIRLDWRDDHIALVRDYRQVPYITRDARFVALPNS